MSTGCFTAHLLAPYLLTIGIAAGVALPVAAEPSPVKKCQPQKFDGSGTIDFASYKGKVVYLDYWASWCGPCRASFPFMNELQKQFSNDVVVIGVSVDADKKDADGFLKETNASFLLGIDTVGICPQEFGVNGMPSTYIFDRNGELAYSHEGFRINDPEKLRAKLKEIVDKK
jgi:cytochrome c biogenesis protein CcmG, thiol:disulfide interchange protein DsbE